MFIADLHPTVHTRFHPMAGLGDSGDPVSVAAQTLSDALDHALASNSALDLSAFNAIMLAVSDPTANNALQVASATANKGVDETLNIGVFGAAQTGQDPSSVATEGAADVASARHMIAQLLSGSTAGGALPSTNASATPEQQAALQAKIAASQQSVLAAYLTGGAQGAAQGLAADASAVKSAAAGALSLLPWYVKLGVPALLAYLIYRKVGK